MNRIATATGKIRSFILRKENKVMIGLILFYCVGVLGMSFQSTRPLFTRLTPLALLLSISALAIFHNPRADRKALLVFFSVFLISFFIEVIGVNTGLLFGNYTYGSGLGIKLFNTPLIIGVNWLLLVYCTGIIVNTLRLTISLKIVISSVLMVSYDLIMEQIAPQLDMWQFEGGVPVRNFVAWFIIAFLLHLFLKLTGIRFENRIAGFIFFLQMGFFIAIFTLFKLIE